MRFHFKTTARPKLLAQAIHRILPSSTLSASQQLAARIYGFANWHELEQDVGKTQLSAWDCDAPEETVRQRHAYQRRVLTQTLGPGMAGMVPRILSAITPTSPHTAQLYAQAKLCSSKGTPSLALAQCSLFGAKLDQSAPRYLGCSLDTSPDRVAVALSLSPPFGQRLRSALAADRCWGQPTFKKTKTGVRQTSWFRGVAFNETKSAIAAAAVWSIEVEGFSNPAKPPVVRCRLAEVWAEAGLTCPLHLLGDQLATAWWRLRLASWTEAGALEAQNLQEATKGLELVEQFLLMNAHRDTTPVEPIEVHLPNNKRSLPAFLSLRAQFQHLVCIELRQERCPDLMFHLDYHELPDSYLEWGMSSYDWENLLTSAQAKLWSFQKKGSAVVVVYEKLKHSTPLVLERQAEPSY